MFKITALLLAAASLASCAGRDTGVVNYRTVTDPDKGIYYVYDGVLDHFELTDSKGQRVDVTRQGY